MLTVTFLSMKTSTMGGDLHLPISCGGARMSFKFWDTKYVHGLTSMR